MKYLALIVLSIAASTSDGLSCFTGNETWRISLRNLDQDDYLGRIKDLPTREGIGDSGCKVWLAVNYYRETLDLSFFGNPAHRYIEHNSVRLDTIVWPIGAQSSIVVNYLQHVCSDVDCQITFIKNHLPWLMKARYSELATRIAPLIRRPTSRKGQCLNNYYRNETCPSQMCRLFISDFDEPILVHSSCVTDDSVNSARLTITHFTDFKGITSKFYYNLVCDYETCNNRHTAEAFAFLLRDHYNTTAMLDTLRFPEQSQTTTKTSSLSVRSHSVTNTKANTTTIRAATSRKNNAHPLESIQTMIYALHLLLYIHLLYDRCGNR